MNVITQVDPQVSHCLAVLYESVSVKLKISSFSLLCIFFVKSPFIVKQGKQLAVKVTAKDGWLIWSQVGSNRYGSRTAVLLIAAHYLTTTISEIDFEVVPSLCLMTTFWENLLLATEFYLSLLYLIVYGTLLTDYLIRHTCYIFFLNIIRNFTFFRCGHFSFSHVKRKNIGQV